MGDEMRRIINNSLKDLEQNCEDLREEKRAETEQKLEQLVIQAAEFSAEYKRKAELAMQNSSDQVNFLRTQMYNLRSIFYKQICSQFTPSTADVIFYYLRRDESNTDATTPRFDHSDRWYEFCSCMFWFSFWFNRPLGNNSADLEYLLIKHPRLLLNPFSLNILNTLQEPLQFERLHTLMMTIKDEVGRTCLFNSIVSLPKTAIKYYQNHTQELYDLLSIQDINGQTALHVNAFWVTDLLKLTYTPQHGGALMNLIRIKDKNDQRALQTVNGWVHDYLWWLIEQVLINRYILFDKPNVLIIYNTKNRVGAEYEAETIYEAFESTNMFRTKFEKDKTSYEILDLIKETANKEPWEIIQSALVVVLLSHGSVGVIDDCRGRQVSFTSIESAMCQRKLQNRPKILIVQCCQHRKPRYHQWSQDIGVPHPRLPYIPRNPDFCAIMSSVPGQPSDRGFFIPLLAKQIKMCQNESIQLMVEKVHQRMTEVHQRMTEVHQRMTEVHQRMTEVHQRMTAQKSTQTPVIQSTLQAEFCPMIRDPVDRNPVDRNW